MEEIVEAKRSELVRLCQCHRVQRLELFRFAATAERVDPSRSDLDFIVQFAAAEPMEYAHDYFSLPEALENLFGRP